MIQNHLTSQPLSKRLEKLGVPQKSCFAWKPFYSITNDTSIDWQGTFSIQDNQNTLSNGQDVFKPWYAKKKELEKHNCSAFLSSELGELLPQYIVKDGYSLNLHIIRSSVWRLYYGNPSEDYSVKFTAKTGDSLAESMGLMLEYLILNGLIKI